jgi:hypothetical protein
MERWLKQDESGVTWTQFQMNWTEADTTREVKPAAVARVCPAGAG